MVKSSDKKNASLPPARMISPILQAAFSKIRDPDCYLMGLHEPDIVLPDNILMFVRRQGMLSHLPKSNLQQFILILNLQGRGDVILDRMRVHLFPRHALLIFPGQAHYYENLDAKRLTWFYIGFRPASQSAYALFRNMPIPLSALAWQYAERLALDQVHPERTTSYITGRITVTLWLLLMELINTLKVHGRTPPARREANLRPIDQLRSFIMENLGKSLSLADLARHMNMSLSSLKNFSRKNLNMGLARFVREQRLYFARGLMTTTNLTLTEIAAQCGFNSIYAFSRTFKRAMKIPPTAHRARIMAAACQTKKPG